MKTEPAQGDDRQVLPDEIRHPDRYLGALATLVYRRRIEELGPEAAIDPYLERRRVKIPQQRRSAENA